MRRNPRGKTLELMPDPTTLGPQLVEKVERFLETLDLNQYLSELIKRESHLEMVTPPESGVLCFRYACNGVDEQDLDGLNRMILYELWKINKESIKEDHVQGKYVLKACQMQQYYNHTDLDILVERITTMGDTIVKEYL